MTHLCDSCREGLVLTRDNGDKQWWCHSRGTTGLLMPNDVRSCTDHEDRRFTPKWELEKIGWELKTDKRGTAIGFTPPVEKR